MNQGRAHQLKAPTSWREFARQVRHRNLPLLTRLDDFNNAILVTGCQRSGTTMLSGIINVSSGIRQFAPEDEHEFTTALVLSGQHQLAHSPSDRFCFQTTYVNENYTEYFQLQGDHKIVWLLRNPHSVVFSMCYNWGHYALTELFEGCGLANTGWLERLRYDFLGHRGLNKLQMACYAYVGKVSQLFDLHSNLPEPPFVVNYDQLTQKRHTVLPAIYGYIDLAYRNNYAARVHANSIAKSAQLSKKQTQMIDSICGPAYQKALALVSHD